MKKIIIKFVGGFFWILGFVTTAIVMMCCPKSTVQKWEKWLDS